MRWSYLKFLFSKTIMGALAMILLIPLISDVLKEIGIELSDLKIPVIGGLFLIICFILYKYFCPNIIQKYKNKESFSSWATKENINIHSQLKLLDNQSDKEIIKALGESAKVLFPMEAGLNYSRGKAIKEYAKIEYNLQDQSNDVVSLLLLFFTIIAVVLTNWLTITRIIRILGG